MNKDGLDLDDVKERKKTLPRMDANSPAWTKMANSLARNFAPPIHPCRDCGGPVISGYICSRCGSVDP